MYNLPYLARFESMHSTTPSSISIPCSKVSTGSSLLLPLNHSTVVSANILEKKFNTLSNSNDEESNLNETNSVVAFVEKKLDEKLIRGSFHEGKEVLKTFRCLCEKSLNLD